MVTHLSNNAAATIKGKVSCLFCADFLSSSNYIMATLAQGSLTGVNSSGGMEELLPLVKQLTDPEQVCQSMVSSLLDQ